MQSGSSYSGLFAIAFSFTLCNGKNPCSITFMQGLMQSHLSNCFDTQKLLPVPSESKPCPALKEATCRNKQSFPVLGVCRMPEDKKGMAQCMSCQELLYQKCQKIPNAGFTEKVPWHCSSCSL